MIRWPQDALIFSVRLGPYACYAAGYVEGDTHQLELLGATAGPQGTELHALRVHLVPSPADVDPLLRRLATDRSAANLGAPFSPIHGAWGTVDELQPRTPDRRRMNVQVVVAESLPGNVHVGDLARALFKARGTPPIGIAVSVARAYAAAAERAAALGVGLRSSLGNVVIAWDGTIHVQPRSWPGRPEAVGIGRLLRELVDGPEVLSSGGAARNDVPALLRDLIRVTTAYVERPATIAEVRGALDTLAEEHPFSPLDFAGVLAQLFPEDRAHDNAFRDDLAAGTLADYAMRDIELFDADRAPLSAAFGELDATP